MIIFKRNEEYIDLKRVNLRKPTKSSTYLIAQQFITIRNDQTQWGHFRNLHPSFAAILISKLCVLPESMSSWSLQLSTISSTFIVKQQIVLVMSWMEISGVSSPDSGSTYGSDIVFESVSSTSITKICFSLQTCPAMKDSGNQ